MKKFFLICLLFALLFTGCSSEEKVSEGSTREQDLNTLADLVDVINNADKVMIMSLQRKAFDQIQKSEERIKKLEEDLKKQLEDFDLDQFKNQGGFNLEQESSFSAGDYTFQKLQNTTSSVDPNAMIQQQEQSIKDELKKITQQKMAEVEKARQKALDIQKRGTLVGREKEALEKFLAWVDSDKRANEEYIKATESLSIKKIADSCEHDYTTREQTGNVVVTTVYFKCTILLEYEKKVKFAKKKREEFEEIWKPIHEQLFGYPPLHPDTGKVEYQMKGNKPTGKMLYTDFEGKKRTIINSSYAGRKLKIENLPDEVYVPFDHDGFPDWSEWRVAEFKLPRKYWRSSDDHQFRHLSKQLYDKMKTDPQLAQEVEDGLWELIEKGAGEKNHPTRARIAKYFREHTKLSNELDKIDPAMKEDLLAGRGNSKLYKLIQEDPKIKKLFQDANAKWAKENEYPLAFTWNHHQTPGKMELVKARIHNNVRHTGGRSIWGGAKR